MIAMPAAATVPGDPTAPPASPLVRPVGPLARVIQVLAAVTALLYAWRLLAVRELFVWARLQASSSWPLIWLAWLFGMPGDRLIAVALALSLPAAVLTLLACAFRRRLGGAYLGLRGRLGPTYPRLTGALVVVLMAALAAPPFPGFFALLAVLIQMPAVCVLTVLAVSAAPVLAVLVALVLAVLVALVLAVLAVTATAGVVVAVVEPILVTAEPTYDLLMIKSELNN